MPARLGSNGRRSCVMGAEVSMLENPLEQSPFFRTGPGMSSRPPSDGLVQGGEREPDTKIQDRQPPPAGPLSAASAGCNGDTQGMQV